MDPPQERRAARLIGRSTAGVANEQWPPQPATHKKPQPGPREHIPAPPGPFRHTVSTRKDGTADRAPWWDRFARRRQLQHGAGKRSGDQADQDGEPDGQTPPRRPVTAFVLAGGGSRGAVQVGMLAELVDRGIDADRVYGASVGAVNGAAYAGDPTPDGMERLQRIWRSLSGDTIFPRRRGHGPWTFFQQRPAVHANTGLRRILEEGLRFDNLEDAAVPIEVVATSLHDGRERWLTQGPAIEAVLASAAIPAMFPPVQIGDELLIDGGVVDNVPISRAIDAGATRVYVLLCGPLHYRPRPAKRPVEAVLTGFFVAVHARFARELTMVPSDVEVIVFSGGGDPSADYRDFSGTSELIAAGRAEVAAVLDGGSDVAANDGRSTPEEAVDDGPGGDHGHPLHDDPGRRRDASRAGAGSGAPPGPAPVAEAAGQGAAGAGTHLRAGDGEPPPVRRLRPPLRRSQRAGGMAAT
jgi:NTE family protein